MPPKVRVTQQMILDAAFQLLREQGVGAVNIRAVAKRLGCSTQPVMYNFGTADALIRALYRRADEYHSEYLMDLDPEDPMISLGRNYIRFAREEKNLFQFLFQSDQFSGFSMEALFQEPALSPVIEMVSAVSGCSREDAVGLFRKMFIVAHGYASLLANNAMEYDEALCLQDLEFVFRDIF